jgi:hypothetical protein
MCHSRLHPVATLAVRQPAHQRGPWHCLRRSPYASEQPPPTTTLPPPPTPSPSLAASAAEYTPLSLLLLNSLDLLQLRCVAHHCCLLLCRLPAPNWPQLSSSATWSTAPPPHFLTAPPPASSSGQPTASPPSLWPR